MKGNNKIIYLVFFCSFITQICVGQHWEKVGTPQGNEIYTLFSDSSTGRLYAGGLNHLAYWDGSIWTNFNNTNFYKVWTIMRYKEQIYVGGLNTSTVPFEPLKIWDSTNFSIPGQGLQILLGGPPEVRALTIFQDTLYAGGSFDLSGSDTIYKVGKFDSINWENLDNTNWTTTWSQSDIFTFISYNSALYMGGQFGCTIPSIISIAKWDGYSWSPVGNLGCNITANAFAVYKGELYVAGNVNITNGCFGNVVKWNDTTWSDVGGGMNGGVRCLYVFNNELYAGGEFTTAGGVPAINIAKWNGTEWCSLGSNINGPVYSITSYNDTLIIGGGFWKIDSDTINEIAKWIGGSYVDTCGNSSGIAELQNLQQNLSIFPNPFSNSTTLQTSKPLQNASLFIYDMLGKVVKSIDNLNGTEIKISGVGMKGGMYFFTVIDAKGFIGNGKMIIE